MNRIMGVFVLLAVVTATLTALAEDSTNRYWVYFRDKGIAPWAEAAAFNEAAANLTLAARERRAREMPVLVDRHDLPVHGYYLAQVRQSGVYVRHASRYLNAVSVEATAAQADRLRSLPSVARVERFRLVRTAPPAPPRRALDIDYGPSYGQNQLCRVPEAHARGLTGQGILVCMLDTGARLDHEAFNQMTVVATYDFLHNDTIVSNQPGQDTDPFQHYHGTGVLATMGGFVDSVLIGPAYGANFMVAKTERTASETRDEEDTYVAGIEWADSMGARITSSSLGYIGNWPDFWYSFEDLDGQTAVTTIALRIAASHGILCVTAAGNENGGAWNHLVTPADADSILAVGAVTSEGNIVGFSSRGPTADNRIKPDVSAQGADVYCASADTTNSYALWSGTSLATPIVAGIAALVMEAHPDWTAQQVREAIMNTASQHDSPNNDYGWGIVDAAAAVDYELSVEREPAPVVPRSAVMIASYPNPVNGTGVVQLSLPLAGTGTLALYDLLGRQVHAWPQERWAAGNSRVEFEAASLATGIYLAKFSGTPGEAVAKVVVLK